MHLRNKSILVISPQDWETMFLAKHHYAIELAKLGNDVFFLNPPDNRKWSPIRKPTRISICESTVHPRLHLIKHKLFFPFILKFHARIAFDQLMRLQVKDILKRIGSPVHVVWSFDIGNLYPMSNFKNAFKIFHPVDEPRDMHGIRAAQNADILFGVTTEI